MMMMMMMPQSYPGPEWHYHHLILITIDAEREAHKVSPWAIKVATNDTLKCSLVWMAYCLARSSLVPKKPRSTKQSFNHSESKSVSRSQLGLAKPFRNQWPLSPGAIHQDLWHQKFWRGPVWCQNSYFKEQGRFQFPQSDLAPSVWHQSLFGTWKGSRTSLHIPLNHLPNTQDLLALKAKKLTNSVPPANIDDVLTLKGHKPTLDFSFRRQIHMTGNK